MKQQSVTTHFSHFLYQGSYGVNLSKAVLSSGKSFTAFGMIHRCILVLFCFQRAFKANSKEFQQNFFQVVCYLLLNNPESLKGEGPACSCQRTMRVERVDEIQEVGGQT